MARYNVGAIAKELERKQNDELFLMITKYSANGSLSPITCTAIYNCLMRNNIRSIKTLIDILPDLIEGKQKIRGLGKKKLLAMQNMLSAYKA